MLFRVWKFIVPMSKPLNILLHQDKSEIYSATITKERAMNRTSTIIDAQNSILRRGHNICEAQVE